MAKKQQSFNYSPEIPLMWNPTTTFEERNLEPEIPYAPLQSDYDKPRNLTQRDFRKIPESVMSGDPHAYHNYYPLSEQKMKGGPTKSDEYTHGTDHPENFRYYYDKAEKKYYRLPNAEYYNNGATSENFPQISYEEFLQKLPALPVFGSFKNGGKIPTYLKLFVTK